MRRGLAVVAALMLALPMGWSDASPTDVRLEVYRVSDCSSAQACPDGKRLEAGAGATGVLRLRARAHDPLGLRRIRVEGKQAGTSRWICIAEREVRGQINADAWFEWDSYLWPAPEEAPEDHRCTHTLPHIHGEPTPNGEMDLRATAISFVDDQDKASSPATAIDLRNPAASPTWSRDARVVEGTRSVALAWVPNREDDLVAYAILRAGAAGETRRLIDARSPEAGGCTKFADAEIRCSDSLPEQGGTYTYRLVAMRPGGTQSCLGQRCVASPASAPTMVTVPPAQRGSGQPNPGGELTPIPGESSSAPEPSSSGIHGGDFEPPDEDTSPLASGDDPSNSSTTPLVVFAILLLAGAGLAGFTLVKSRRGS